MGIFSKHHRYRNAGEGVNVNNAEEFGIPVRALFTSSKVFSLHHRIEIMDDHEQVIYRSQSKAFSIHDKTEVQDAAGRHVAHIERKLFSLHQRHFVTMADGVSFELSSELFHIYKDIINIEGLGWQLRGNIWALNFQLYDKDGSVIAVISQKMLSLHDRYCIDIYKPEYEQIAVAILITLQHMIADRENSAAASSGGGSGD